MGFKPIMPLVLIVAFLGFASVAYFQPAFATSVTLSQSTCTLGGGSWNSGTCTISGTYTNLSGNILNIPSGTTLKISSGGTGSNSGQIIINSGGTLINNHQLTNNAGGEISNSGAITNSGTISNSGTIQHVFPTASFSNSGTFTSTGQIELVGTVSSSMTLSSLGYTGVTNFVVLSHDTLTIDASEQLTIPSGYTLANSGTITNAGTIIDTDTITNNAGGQIICANSAANGISIDPGNTLTNNFGGQITIINNDISIGISNNGGTITNAGAITITNIGDTVGIGNTGTLSNSGNITVSSGATGVTNQNFESIVSTITNNAGGQIIIQNSVGEGIEIDSGTLSNSGLITVSNSGNSVGIHIQPGSTLSNLHTLANSGSIYNSGEITNSDEFINTGTLQHVFPTATFSSSGLFRNFVEGNPQIGQVELVGTISSSVILNSLGYPITTFVVLSPDTLTISSQSLTIPTGYTLSNSGTISNSGTLNVISGGSLANSGTIQHVFPAASFSNSGTFTNTGQIELVGNTSTPISLDSLGYLPVTNFVILSPDTLTISSGGSLTIPNGYLFTIQGGTNGAKLNIDLTHDYLLVKSGGGVLIKAGGAIN